MPKIKGVKCIIHPDLYREMEKERKKFESKGVRVTQMDLTKLFARKITAKQGVIGYAKQKTKKARYR